MDLEIFEKNNGFVVVEYEYGMEVGKTGVEWYGKDDHPSLLNHISRSLSFEGWGDYTEKLEKQHWKMLKTINELTLKADKYDAIYWKVKDVVKSLSAIELEIEKVY